MKNVFFVFTLLILSASILWAHSGVKDPNNAVTKVNAPKITALWLEGTDCIPIAVKIGKPYDISIEVINSFLI